MRRAASFKSRNLLPDVETAAQQYMQNEGLEHEIKGINHELLAIVVDLRDYTIGSNAGAELGMAESFDIDFNQYKYLMETRLSGSLTAPYSALTISRKKA